MREIIPHLRRLAIIGDAGFLQAALEMREVKDAASTFGIEITPLEVRRSEDIAPALEGLQADALYVIGTALLTSNVPIIITLALSARLPTMFGASEYVAQELSSLTHQISPTCFVAQPSMWTRFCEVRSPAIFRSSSRPNLILRSTSRPPRRSASPFQESCSPARPGDRITVSLPQRGMSAFGGFAHKAPLREGFLCRRFEAADQQIKLFDRVLWSSTDDRRARA